LFSAICLFLCTSMRVATMCRLVTCELPRLSDCGQAGGSTHQPTGMGTSPALVLTLLLVTCTPVKQAGHPVSSPALSVGGSSEWSILAIGGTSVVRSLTLDACSRVRWRWAAWTRACWTKSLASWPI
jgi:hypothetical protein